MLMRVARARFACVRFQKLPQNSQCRPGVKGQGLEDDRAMPMEHQTVKVRKREKIALTCLLPGINPKFSL